MIAPLRTGHAYASDDHLLRVDVIRGRWAATRFAPDHIIKQQVFGSNKVVHQQITQWLWPKGQH
jgi:hypothetical protein